MPIVTCRECERDASTQAPHCPHCGAPKPSNKAPPADPFLVRFWLTLLAVSAFAIAGNFRVVTDVPGVRIISRQTFGFDDPIASVEDCTSVPWIVAIAAHGRLCRDLQAAGILQDDEARRMEIEMEIERRLRELGVNRR